MQIAVTAAYGVRQKDATCLVIPASASDAMSQKALAVGLFFIFYFRTFLLLHIGAPVIVYS